MACKTCNKKSGGIIKNIIDLKKGIKKEISKPTNSSPDNKYELLDYEKIILTIFGWIPLIIGYYQIIKFVINLF
jgi:hypothetical protein